MIHFVHGQAARFCKTSVLLLATCFGLSPVAYGQAVDLPANSIPTTIAPADTNAPQGQLPPDYFKKMEGRVVKSLVDMGQIQRDSDRLSKDINDLSKFLQDTMIDVSYPVLLPAVSTNPVTLAEPNFKMYSGHFPEARTKFVVSSVTNIGNLIAVVEEDMSNMDIPPDRADAVKPLLSDAHEVLDTVKSDYAILYTQINSPTIDAEIMAGKLLDMKRYLATVDQDLTAIFRIVNLKNATPETINAIVGLKLFSRDAHWLGIIAQYLGDSAKQLSPLAAYVQNAEDQGWMVMGPSMKQYSQIERSPYAKAQMSELNKRMNQLSEYITAVNSDLQSLRKQDPSIAADVDGISAMVNDVQSRYQQIQNMITTPPTNDLGPLIYNQAQSMVDDMKQVDKAEHQLADKLVGNNSIF